MKLKVNDSVVGTIILPSISYKGMEAGDELEFSDKLIFSPDIQSAMKSGFITVEGSDAVELKIVKIHNKSNGSLSVPGYGILKSGFKIEMQMDDTDPASLQKFMNMDQIEVEFPPSDKPNPKRRGKKLSNKTSIKKTIKNKVKRIKRKEHPSEKKEVPSRESDNVKSENQITKTASDLIVDLDSPDDDSESDINWVDREQARERVNSHPILRNQNED